METEMQIRFQDKNCSHYSKEQSSEYKNKDATFSCSAQSARLIHAIIGSNIADVDIFKFSVLLLYLHSEAEGWVVPLSLNAASFTQMQVFAQWIKE